MAEVINLDRSVELKIIYPIGVKEKLIFTNNEEETLTDLFEVIIRHPNGKEFDNIQIGEKLSVVENKLTWTINYEADNIEEKTYLFEIRNKTQDWREFHGTFVVTNTLR